MSFNHIKSKKKRSLVKTAAIFTLACFTATSITGPKALAAIDSRTPIETSSKIPSSLVSSKTILPSDLGTLADEFNAKPSNSKIFLVQDAHAIPDAQKKIQGIIEFLTRHYGVKTVAVEGASKELDTQIFQSFPDKKLLSNVFASYMEKGELTGVAAAAIFSRQTTDHSPQTREKDFNRGPSTVDRGLVFQGIENWHLYEEGLGLYQEAMSSEAELQKKIEDGRKRLEAEKKKVYSKKLLEIDEAMEKFYDNKSDLIETLKVLSKFETPKGELALILKKTTDHRPQSTALEIKRAAKEVERLLRRPASGGTPRNDVIAIPPGREKQSHDSRLATHDVTDFQLKKQAYQTSQISLEAYALYLTELAKKLGTGPRLSDGQAHFGPVPALMKAAEEERRLQNIQGTKLFKDFEEYVDQVVSREIATSPTAPHNDVIASAAKQSLYEKTKELRLLSKLIKLELTREEWLEVKRLKSEKVKKLEIEKLLTFEHFNFSTHFSFYENAEAREKAFLKNLEKKYRVQGTAYSELKRSTHDASRSTIIVAGGFHTEGLAAALKAKNISYAVITPKITHLPSENFYREQMKGHVSWSSYMKPKNGRVNLYDAFVRATRDKLVQSTAYGVQSEKNAVRSTHPAVLKNWRDQILIDLAQNEHIEKAGEYTRFIDELRDGSRLSADAISSSGEPSLKLLREKWNTVVKNFTNGLLRLDKENRYTADNIATLFQRPTMLQAEGNNPFVPTATVPVFNEGPMTAQELAGLPVNVSAHENRSPAVAGIPANSQTIEPLKTRSEVRGTNSEKLRVNSENAVSDTHNFSPFTPHSQSSRSEVRADRRGNDNTDKKPSTPSGSLLQLAAPLGLIALVIAVTSQIQIPKSSVIKTGNPSALSYNVLSNQIENFHRASSRYPGYEGFQIQARANPGVSKSGILEITAGGKIHSFANVYQFYFMEEKNAGIAVFHRVSDSTRSLALRMTIVAPNGSARMLTLEDFTRKFPSTASVFGFPRSATESSPTRSELRAKKTPESILQISRLKIVAYVTAGLLLLLGAKLPGLLSLRADDSAARQKQIKESGVVDYPIAGYTSELMEKQFDAASKLLNLYEGKATIEMLSAAYQLRNQSRNQNFIRIADGILSAYEIPVTDLISFKGGTVRLEVSRFSPKTKEEEKIIQTYRLNRWNPYDIHAKSQVPVLTYEFNIPSKKITTREFTWSLAPKSFHSTTSSGTPFKFAGQSAQFYSFNMGVHAHLVVAQSRFRIELLRSYNPNIPEDRQNVLLLPGFDAQSIENAPPDALQKQAVPLSMILPDLHPILRKEKGRLTSHRLYEGTLPKNTYLSSFSIVVLGEPKETELGKLTITSNFQGQTNTRPYLLKDLNARSELRAAQPAEKNQSWLNRNKSLLLITAILAGLAIIPFAYQIMVPKTTKFDQIESAYKTAIATDQMPALIREGLGKRTTTTWKGRKVDLIYGYHGSHRLAEHLKNALKPIVTGPTTLNQVVIFEGLGLVPEGIMADQQVVQALQSVSPVRIIDIIPGSLDPKVISRIAEKLNLSEQEVRNIQIYDAFKEQIDLYSQIPGARTGMAWSGLVQYVYIQTRMHGNSLSDLMREVAAMLLTDAQINTFASNWQRVRSASIEARNEIARETLERETPDGATIVAAVGGHHTPVFGVPFDPEAISKEEQITPADVRKNLNILKGLRIIAPRSPAENTPTLPADKQGRPEGENRSEVRKDESTDIPEQPSVSTRQTAKVAEHERLYVVPNQWITITEIDSKKNQVTVTMPRDSWLGQVILEIGNVIYVWGNYYVKLLNIIPSEDGHHPAKAEFEILRRSEMREEANQNTAKPRRSLMPILTAAVVLAGFFGADKVAIKTARQWWKDVGSMLPRNQVQTTSISNPVYGYFGTHATSRYTERAKSAFSTQWKRYLDGGGNEIIFFLEAGISPQTLFKKLPPQNLSNDNSVTEDPYSFIKQHAASYKAIYDEILRLEEEELNSGERITIPPQADSREFMKLFLVSERARFAKQFPNAQFKIRLEKMPFAMWLELAPDISPYMEEILKNRVDPSSWERYKKYLAPYLRAQREWNVWFREQAIASEAKRNPTAFISFSRDGQHLRNNYDVFAKGAPRWSAESELYFLNMQLLEKKIMNDEPLTNEEYAEYYIKSFVIPKELKAIGEMENPAVVKVLVKAIEEIHNDGGFLKLLQKLFARKSYSDGGEEIREEMFTRIVSEMPGEDLPNKTRVFSNAEDYARAVEIFHRALENLLEREPRLIANLDANGHIRSGDYFGLLEKPIEVYRTNLLHSGNQWFHSRIRHPRFAAPRSPNPRSEMRTQDESEDIKKAQVLTTPSEVLSRSLPVKNSSEPVYEMLRAEPFIGVRATSFSQSRIDLEFINHEKKVTKVIAPLADWTTIALPGFPNAKIWIANTNQVDNTTGQNIPIVEFTIQLGSPRTATRSELRNPNFHRFRFKPSENEHYFFIRFGNYTFRTVKRFLIESQQENTKVPLPLIEQQKMAASQPPSWEIIGSVQTPDYYSFILKLVQFLYNLKDSVEPGNAINVGITYEQNTLHIAQPNAIQHKFWPYKGRIKEWNGLKRNEKDVLPINQDKLNEDLKPYIIIFAYLPIVFSQNRSLQEIQKLLADLAEKSFLEKLITATSLGYVKTSRSEVRTLNAKQLTVKLIGNKIVIDDKNGNHFTASDALDLVRELKKREIPASIPPNSPNKITIGTESGIEFSDAEGILKALLKFYKLNERVVEPKQEEKMKNFKEALQKLTKDSPEITTLLDAVTAKVGETEYQPLFNVYNFQKHVADQNSEKFVYSIKKLDDDSLALLFKIASENNLVNIDGSLKRSEVRENYNSRDPELLIPLLERMVIKPLKERGSHTEIVNKLISILSSLKSVKKFDTFENRNLLHQASQKIRNVSESLSLALAPANTMIRILKISSQLETLASDSRLEKTIRKKNKTFQESINEVLRDGYDSLSLQKLAEFMENLDPEVFKDELLFALANTQLMSSTRSSIINDLITHHRQKSLLTYIESSFGPYQSTTPFAGANILNHFSWLMIDAKQALKMRSEIRQTAQITLDTLWKRTAANSSANPSKIRKTAQRLSRVPASRASEIILDLSDEFFTNHVGEITVISQSDQVMADDAVTIANAISSLLETRFIRQVITSQQLEASGNPALAVREAIKTAGILASASDKLLIQLILPVNFKLKNLGHNKKDPWQIQPTGDGGYAIAHASVALNQFDLNSMKPSLVIDNSSSSQTLQSEIDIHQNRLQYQPHTFGNFLTGGAALLARDALSVRSWIVSNGTVFFVQDQQALDQLGALARLVQGVLASRRTAVAA